MKKRDIVEAARQRMSDAIEKDRENREQAIDDMEKLAGRQWPEDIKQARIEAGRPTPVINHLAKFVRQVTGDIRKLNPAIKVIPADNAATEEVAEIYSGLIKHIEYRSDAASVYEQGAESAAQCGMGAFRILTEYESDDSFDQEILIKRVPNPFSVYWDPEARASTRADAMFCFITEQMKAEDFAKEYPDADRMDVEHDGVTDGLENWHSTGSVVVAEYFWKEPTTKTISLLMDGSIVEDAVAPQYIIKQRKVATHKVMWAKVSGHDVLEGPVEFPCKHIPVVAVMGEELHVGEDIVRTSVIRFAKDPQQLYNYLSATVTEVVALQPKAPYLVTAKQIAGLETFWNESNDSNRPYLPYNADEKAGAPTRVPPPMPSAGLSTELMRAAEDMKATTGIYDAGLGNQSNETSGVAIRQRQLESDISTSIYTDNLEKAIGLCGRILVDMIPKIYDANRMVRIVGQDDAEKLVEINGEQLTLEGPQAINPLTLGRYDVRVTVGPNYSTRRQETAESMMQFVQAFPTAGQVAGDLIAKAMDWPDADKLAERLKKTLPPGMIDREDMSPEDQQAMQAQEQQAMQMQQAEMQMQEQMRQAAMAKQVADAEKAQAGAAKAGSDAQSAAFDVMLKQLEVSAQTGEIQAVIQQAVQQALIAQMQQGQRPTF